MPNRLAAEASPYLRQHADNPVDWYPWCEEALTRARTEDRPILLSIGYSACHWCHVMAHECFADAETAALMNALFVNVKVDREERPDLDHLYQRAHQLLTGRPGGWPLTVFLSPDQTPFFSGTYFPKQGRHGLIGFPELMARIDQVWHERRPELEQRNEVLRRHLASLTAPAASDDSPDVQALAGSAIATLCAQCDGRNGGLRGAPKFPHPVEWRLLLERGDARARAAALTALGAMADGGLQDHAGGGFFRYCVDAEWQIPHFEKMLYDNALLLPLFAEAARDTGEARLADAARGIVAWLLREMSVDADGEFGFCASLDADAAHEEGAFYVWTPETARAVLGDGRWPLAEAAFNFRLAPNFEGRAWHLRRSTDEAALAMQLGQPVEAIRARLADIAATLRAAREARPRPGRDDKRITAWNALMVGGLARAGAALAEPAWVALAQRAADTLRQHHWQNGRLFAIRQDGALRLNAYLDDHAYLLDALVTLLATDWRDADLAFAGVLAEAMIERYQDETGLLWMVSSDHERLLTRPREVHDDAMPAGASVAIGALAKLAAITGQPRWHEAARRAFVALLPEAAAYPAAAASFWLAAPWVSDTPPVVMVFAARSEHEAWRRAIREWLPPAGLCLCRDASDQTARATLCTAQRCLPPVADPDALHAAWRSLAPAAKD